MTRFRRFDVWVGKNLFHPVIIRMCHLLNMGNHLLGRLIELVWFLVLLWYMNTTSIVMWVFMLSLGVTIVACLELLRDRPYQQDLLWLRALWWWFLWSDIIFTAVFEYKPPSIISPILMLFVLYCHTIDRLPPKPTQEKRTHKKIAIQGS